MLSVAVHEQHGAQPGMIEAGEKRRLLAEIARERDHLDVEVFGGKFARGGKRRVAAAVVHIDRFGRQSALRLERAGDLDDAGVKGGEIVGLVEQGNHDRKAGFRPAARPCGSAGAAGSGHRIAFHRPRLFGPVPARGGGCGQGGGGGRGGGRRGGGGALGGAAGRSKGGPAMRLPAPLDRLQRRFARAWHERAVTLKAASFAMVGVVNTLIDYSVFLSAYYLLKLPLIPANVLAWLVAVSGSYVMNCYITFAAESGRQLRWRAYGAFVAAGVVGVIANTTVLVVASRWLPVPLA